MRRLIFVVLLFAWWLIAAVLFCPHFAAAETYRVGPGETYEQLSSVPALGPGDIVEVMGGATYEGDVVFDFEWDGTEAMPIIVRGVPDAGGARPIISGGTNTIEVQGDHYVFENLDITGGSFRCFFHHAHAITIADTVVHDCPQHGILGADEDSGSLTLIRVEVHSSGEGDRNHQIYMATDESAHPGSVFRMEDCWIHDGNGGNNVKSRAERNEIYSNWIEGAFYHELELIGPDGADEGLAREDSDVVGNVFVKSGENAEFAVVRFGGDGTGQTHGRYRFVANTVLVAPGSGAAVFRLFDGLESVEMHDNVFFMQGGGGVNLLRDAEAVWASGDRIVGGSHNWVPNGSENVPTEWTDTIMGDDPGFTDVAAFDLRPVMTSPLVDQGIADPPTLPSAPFPNPLGTPSRSPAHGVGSVARATVGALDLGAYEFGTESPLSDGGVPRTDAGSVARRDGGAVGGDASTSIDDDEGCDCSASEPSSVAPIALVLLFLRRRLTAGRARR
jgi:MYXO-CTERM domain-containing protein